LTGRCSAIVNGGGEIVVMAPAASSVWGGRGRDGVPKQAVVKVFLHSAGAADRVAATDGLWQAADGDMLAARG